MSRFKNYASALGSSYLALAANIAYTFVSVPLALRYLSNPEFALWGLTVQMAGYIALIDFGMAGASRILIDHKDHKDEPTYGSVIQTTIIVSAVQGLLIIACGFGLAFGLGPLLRVPTEFEREFMLLVIGQCGLLAGTFLTRVFNFLLSAHQRQDVQNYTQAFVFAVSVGVLWLSLALGSGVFSIIWTQLGGWIVTTLITIIWCVRLRVFPNAGSWGRPSWARFRELFAYGRDVFLMVAGNQLINASQVILVTRQLGLEAAAIWVICSRSFVVVTHLIYRIFDNSCPALAEMIVRRDSSQLLHRFRSIVIVSGSASVVAGVTFALCNQPFVELWTNGKAFWPMQNDVLLAAGLIVSVMGRCHAGFTGQTKEFRLMRYVSVFEGLWLVAWSLLLLRWGGIPAMLVTGIAGTLLFSFPFGTWRTARFFKIGWKEVAVNWSWPTLRLVLLLVPVSGVLFLFVRPLPAAFELCVIGSAAATVGTWLFLRYGLDPPLRTELSQRLLTALRALNSSTSRPNEQ